MQEAGGPEALQALAPRWEELAASSHPPPLYMHPDHLRLWLDALAPDADVRVVTAWRGDRWVGFAPFMVVPERFGPLRGSSLRFVGNNVGAPGDLTYLEAWSLGRDPVIADRLLARVSARPRASVWDLGFVPPESPTAQAIRRRLGGGRDASGAEATKPFPSMDLPGAWPEYLAHLSAQSRQKFNKNRRRLEASGSIRLRTERAGEGCARVVESMIANHERWSAGTPREGWFGDRRVKDFLVAAARRLGDRGEYLAVSLELDGRPIAWHAGALSGRTHYSELISYDWSMSERSPGTVMSLQMIEPLIGLGVRRFHLGPGMDQRKTILGGVPVEYPRMRGYRGLWKAADRLAARWRRHRSPLPTSATAAPGAGSG